MSTIESATPTSTTHHATGNERARFLRKVLREDGWTITAHEQKDWNITFSRTVKGKIGEPDVDVVVVMEDKISVCGRFGHVRSFHDAEEVYIPKPRFVHLSYGAVHTVAKIILDGGRLSITGSAGSTSSSKHGLAFVTLHGTVKGINDTVSIGSQTVYVNGKLVCCGSAE